MPGWEMSSSRPTKGEMKEAPALAARIAWAAEKHSVTLTMVPSSESSLQVLSPSRVSGTLTVTFLASRARRRPSASMVGWSRAVTSALTGPGTTAQISWMTSKNFLPVLAMSEGLVVTPSSNPVAASSRISPKSAVSTKNFMASPLLFIKHVPASRPDPSRMREGGRSAVRLFRLLL